MNASTPVRFTFRPLDEGKATVSIGELRWRSTLAWLMSSDGNIMLHAPALHASRAEARVGGERAVQIPRIDPAVYDVWLFQLERNTSSRLEPPALQGRHFAGSPFRLDARTPQAAAKAGGAGGTSGELGVRLPTRQCSLGSPEIDGRWIRCSSICQRECTRDGWVFVPWDCSYRLYEPQAAAAMAGKVAQRRGTPLWIAFVGISYTRGILNSLADLLCDGRCGFFRGGAHSVPRLGSTLKCWGWFDYLHDGIRMSYQDWRLPNHVGNDAPFRQRLAQLIREGPDLLFMQAIPGASQDWFFGFCKQHTQLLKSWRGTMVYSVIQRSTAVAGLDMEQGQATFQNTRQGFLKQLDMLEKEIPGLREKVLLWNINPMLWATIYDTERPLGSCRSTQHWHHYNRPGARRAVLGMSTEMVAHILLAQLVETSSNSHDADLGANAALSGYSATERLLCVNCPKRACCPWVALTQPNYTLSVPRGQLKLSGTASNYGCVKDL